jgi:1-acyl-sn-glycerol-3-phosphate acyltransferase
MRSTQTISSALSPPERATPRDARAAERLDARSALVFALFAYLFERGLRASFHAARMKGAAPAELSAPKLVIYANHPSWWDGVAYAVIARRLMPGRAVYAPIDAVMLERYGFMRRMGAFGVDQTSARGAADFLNLSRAALARGAALMIAAQGRFSDTRERPLRLRPGLAHLADSEPELCFLPLALDYAFWDEKRPEMLFAFGPPLFASELIALRPRERLPRLEQRLTETLDDLCAAAMTRDARLFETFVAGAGGIDPVYDAWRRLKAALRGEAFRPEHGARE